MMNAELDKFNLTVRARATEQQLVPSQHYSITVTEGDVKKEFKDSAIQVRLKAGCPRQVYQKVKQHVQAGGSS
jgi:hypothetical protein